MRHRTCPRHGRQHPCTCAMGHLYRFVEPVLLFLLKKKGRAYGYDLASEVRENALTDADIEISALYRTLRQLEQNACVTSTWDVEHGGPARRLYVLTPRGEQHLEQWVSVLGHMSKSMTQFVKLARSAMEDSTLVGGSEGTEIREHAAVKPQPGSILGAERASMKEEKK